MRRFFALLVTITLLALIGCSKFEEPLTAPPAERPTASISADPLEVEPLQDVLLTLASTNADMCLLGPPGVLILNGDLVVQPELTTTYYFSCAGRGGLAMDSVTVGVIVPPPQLALDSLQFELSGAPVPICDGDCGSNAPTERVLGVFAIPEFFGANARVLDSLVTVRVEILLSGDTQKDEAFAVGRALPPLGGRDWIDHTAACPVVPDDTALGQAFVTVGAEDIGVGTFAYIARHAIEFGCYNPLDEFTTPNSVWFHSIRFVFWREDR